MIGDFTSLQYLTFHSMMDDLFYFCLQEKKRYDIPHICYNLKHLSSQGSPDDFTGNNIHTMQL